MPSAYHRALVLLCDLCGEIAFFVSDWESRITTGDTEDHRGTPANNDYYALSSQVSATRPLRLQLSCFSSATSSKPTRL